MGVICQFFKGFNLFSSLVFFQIKQCLLSGQDQWKQHAKTKPLFIKPYLQLCSPFISEYFVQFM